jgi:hypothetical protein
VLACTPDALDDVRRLAAELDVPSSTAGTAGGGTLLGVELTQLRGAWESD